MKHLYNLLVMVLLLILSGCNLPSATSTSPTSVSVPSTGVAPTKVSQPTPSSATQVVLTASAPDATTFPNPDNYTWQEIVSVLQRPVNLQTDGSKRLFVLEKLGRIRIIENGKLLPYPFLDITDRVNDNGNEQGLLGLAFHPSYAQNGYFYVNYTGSGGTTFISRFQVTSDPNKADPASEVNLLQVKQPFPNHNGGSLAFGPDGYLYAGLGDGGSEGDPHGNAQSLNSLLGKILRLDVDSAQPYAIPPDNPFKSEIFYYGLRNPWRISFDTQTHDLYIADVGQNEWEEIDYMSAGSPGGANFGWNYLEGTHPYQGNPPAGLTPPIAEYSHADGNCAVIGGYVYRGSMPKWNGIYLYGDYCSGKVWGLIHSGSGWQSQLLFDTKININSFGQDASGEVYTLSDDGQVYQLVRK